jgi:hypothetical protein
MFILITSLLILSLILNVVLFVLLRVQFKKIEIYESLIENFTTWITNTKSELQETYLKMKSIDDRGMFFKDDDVGFVFQELLNLISSLNKKIQ